MHYHREMGFWDIIKAIPSLVSLLKELLDLAKKIFGDDPKKFIKDSALAISELKVAKSPEEKINAAKKIQDLVSRL